MEPDGGLDPLLLGRRAAVLDKYEGLKTTYPELPSNLRDYQVSCSHLACVRRIYFTLTLTFRLMSLLNYLSLIHISEPTRPY